MSKNTYSGSGSSSTGNQRATTEPPILGDSSVDITIPEGEAHFHVDCSPQAAHLLSQELAWKDPDAKYTDAYKNGNWDGYHNLFSERTQRAPIGLLDRAVSILEDRGYSVDIDHAFPTAPLIDVQWNFPYELRDYQIEAIEQTMEQRGGIISLPTGAGKTVVALNLIYQLASQSIIFVHTKQLLHQWAERVEATLGIEPGVIGDGEWSEGEITVATMQSVHSKGVDKLSQTYGMAVFDECHRTGAAQTMQEIGLSIDPVWRIGLSATPWRGAEGEEIEIEAVTGGPSAQISATELIDEGYIAKPEFEFLNPMGTRTPNQSNNYHTVIKRCIERDPVRNNAIAEKASELAADGEMVLVTVDRIFHGELIEYALSPTVSEDEFKQAEIDPDNHDPDEILSRMTAIENISQFGSQNAVFLDGSASKSEREETLTDFENGDIDILVTTLLKEGTDIPSISAIVHAEGKKSKIQRIQRAGRALRPENGNTATIVDVVDKGEYIGQHFQQRVGDLKEYYGEYGPEMPWKRH